MPLGGATREPTHRPRSGAAVQMRDARDRHPGDEGDAFEADLHVFQRLITATSRSRPSTEIVPVPRYSRAAEGRAAPRSSARQGAQDVAVGDERDRAVDGAHLGDDAVAAGARRRRASRRRARRRATGTSPGGSRGSPAWSAPRTRRSPTRAGRRAAPSTRGPRAARSRGRARAASRARGEAPGRARRSPSARATSRPSSVSGMSVRPVCLPVARPLGLGVAQRARPRQPSSAAASAMISRRARSSSDAGTSGSGPAMTRASIGAFSAPVTSEQDPVRGVELGQGQRHAVGRRLGRVVHRDADALGVDLREAGEERGRVPVGPHAVERDVEHGVGDLLGVGGGGLVAAELRRHRMPRRLGGVEVRRWRGGGWTRRRRAARSARRRTTGARRASRAASARPARRRATSRAAGERHVRRAVDGARAVDGGRHAPRRRARRPPRGPRSG